MTVHQLIQKLLEIQDSNLKVHFVDYEQGEIEIDEIKVEPRNEYRKSSEHNPIIVKLV